MENMSIKRMFVYVNLVIFSMMCWYIMAELILTAIWREVWH